MISFNLHIPSILFGLCIGFIVASIVLFSILFGDRWSIGFGEGYTACTERMERKRKELNNEEKTSEETEK